MPTKAHFAAWIERKLTFVRTDSTSATITADQMTAIHC